MRQLELEFTTAVRADPTQGEEESSNVPLQMSVDGSMVALVGEGWREVKLVAIGERSTAGPLTNLTYAATLGSAETFGDEALGELVRRGIPWAHDVVSVNDGAAWIQSFVDLQCSRAHRVLDFAHAVSYLALAATEAHGEGTEATRAWFTTWRTTLRHGDPTEVLAALQALPAEDERDRAWTYLGTRRSQIAYRDFVARGWPIGSGCVERAHKGVLQERLKRRGMRWSGTVAEAMIAMRIVGANDRWAETWARIGAQQRAARQAHAATRRADHRRPPPPLKLVQDGKPTANHPWRRFRLRRSPRLPPTI